MNLATRLLKPFKELTTKFKLLNSVILLPILIWPYIFFTTIFFFDAPGNEGQALIYFLLVNSYPIPICIIFLLNSFLLKKNRILGSILPTGLLFAIIIGSIYLGVSIYETQYEKHLEREARKEAGYFSPGSQYRLIDGQIFYQDSILTEADKASFELLPNNWARDNKSYFYLGRKMTEIDYQTFEIFNYHYSKDKNHVYYKDQILQGADPKTFEHIEGSRDARDKSNCYRAGKKIDCSVLPFPSLSWEWSKNSNSFFYHGKRIPQIDYESFELLGGDYAKDKNYVYYESIIVEDADPVTFEYIKGSSMGKDNRFCYDSGLKVNCSEIKK